MSRVPQSNQPISVAPSNSVYTTLAIIGFLAGVLGLVVMWIRASALGVTLL